MTLYKFLKKIKGIKEAQKYGIFLNGVCLHKSELKIKQIYNGDIIHLSTRLFHYQLRKNTIWQGTLKAFGY